MRGKTDFIRWFHRNTNPSFILATLFIVMVVLLSWKDSVGAEDIQGLNDKLIYFPIIRYSERERLGPIFGVNFISSPEDLADEQQYTNGLSTGASFNRWPIYWDKVETSQGVFDWSKQDQAVLGDIAHGLQTNAILLGTPGFYQTAGFEADDLVRPTQNGPFSMTSIQAAAPTTLYQPVFSDSTDIPKPGLGINPNNSWARFVFTAVNRYKPGGILTQQYNIPGGKGIRHWEMWNEPDLSWFWDSSLADYARLLKVGYLAAKQADPYTNVLFGALANNFELADYYQDVLQIFADEGGGDDQNYYHDIFATHSYFYAWQSWYHVYRASQTMAAFGFSRPIWLNETGVPAWDDYPGPVWDSKSAYRATTIEQAYYTIQTAFYATFAGADAIFHFQLYDACGNQRRGSDFPPHNGELCGTYDPCAGDANGLFTNPTDAACFTQHPNPETPRPNYTAYKLLTAYFNDVEPLWRKRPGGPNPYEGPQEWIAFYKPSTGERIIGLWSRVGSDQTANLEATSSSALKILPDGFTEIITPENGYYQIHLPAATNQNAPWDPNLYAIGGRPTIIIESDPLSAALFQN